MSLKAAHKAGITIFTYSYYQQKKKLQTKIIWLFQNHSKSQIWQLTFAYSVHFKDMALQFYLGHYNWS